MDLLRSLRTVLAAHPVGAAYTVALFASLLDLLSTAYALGHPGIAEANPVIAHGITVGWHYVVFQKLAGLAMSAMAARLLLKHVAGWRRGWIVSVHAALVFPALIYFGVSISNLRLGLMAAGTL